MSGHEDSATWIHLRQSAHLLPYVLLRVETREFEVFFYHKMTQFDKAALGLPAELFMSFASVSNEQVDFSRAKVLGVDFNKLLPINTDITKCNIKEFSNRVSLAGSDHI